MVYELNKLLFEMKPALAIILGP